NYSRTALEQSLRVLAADPAVKDITILAHSVQLIGQRLMTGQTLTDSNISLGQGVAAVVGGTAHTVGTVAGAAVAAPLAIIEQPARRQQPTGTELEDSLHNDRQSKPLTQ
ncbi:alpha/beta hydrolase, partial [Rhizobium ruizarguesonis]